MAACWWSSRIGTVRSQRQCADPRANLWNGRAKRSRSGTWSAMSHANGFFTTCSHPTTTPRTPIICISISSATRARFCFVEARSSRPHHAQQPVNEPTWHHEEQQSARERDHQTQEHCDEIQLIQERAERVAPGHESRAQFVNQRDH